MRDHGRRDRHDQCQQAVEAVHPAAGWIVLGRRQEDLHRSEDEEEERERDPLPLLRPGAERGQEDEQLRRVNDREADEAVGVERTLARAGDIGGDQVRLQEDQQDDQRGQDEVDSQEDSHVDEPKPAGG